MRRLSLITLIIFMVSSPTYAQENHSAFVGTFSSTSSNATILEIRTPENIRSDITVETHEFNTIEGNFRIWARAKSKEQENRFIKLIEVKLDERGGNEQTVRVRVLTPKTAPWQGTSYVIGASLEIKIPEGFRVDSRSMFGNVTIEGPLSYVEVDCENGSVEVNNVDGETNIRTSNADIDVSDIEGLISIETVHSDIFASDINITEECGIFSSSGGELEFENINGPIEATTSNDDITVYNLNTETGAILLRNTYGKIKGSNIRGELVAETSYQPIELEDIHLVKGVCKFETMYSPIDVEIAEIGDSHLLISNTFNAINLKLPTDTSAKLILNVGEGGKIHTKGLSIKPLVMDKNRLVGIVGDGISRIEANVEGIGSININGER